MKSIIWQKSKVSPEAICYAQKSQIHPNFLPLLYLVIMKQMVRNDSVWTLKPHTSSSH